MATIRTGNQTIDTFIFMFSTPKSKRIFAAQSTNDILEDYFFFLEGIFTGHPDSSRWCFISPFVVRTFLNAYLHHVSRASICSATTWLLTNVCSPCWSSGHTTEEKTSMSLRDAEKPSSTYYYWQYTIGRRCAKRERMRSSRTTVEWLTPQWLITGSRKTRWQRGHFKTFVDWGSA